MKKLGFILLVGATLVGFGACSNDNEEEINTDPCDTSGVTFSGTVQPLLESRCTGCHNASNASGGVFLHEYAGVKAAVDAGKLEAAVRYEEGAAAMPPDGKLPDCDIRQISEWIDKGAPND